MNRAQKGGLCHMHDRAKDERAHRTAPPEGSRYCDSQPDPEEAHP